MVKTIESMARERLWKLELQREKCPPIIEAAIDSRDWTLHFKLAPDADKTLAAMEIPEEEQRVLVRGLVHHEMGHWEICPFDSDGDYLLLEPICRVVRRKRRNADPKKIDETAKFLANIVSDIIVDTVRAWEDKTTAYADAQTLFFLKEIFRADTLSLLYNVFIRINMELWGKRASVMDRVKELLPDGEHSDIIKRALSFFPRHRQTKHLASWLRDRSNWSPLAEKLATLLIDLMEEEETAEWWRPSPFRDILTVLYEGRAKAVELALQGAESQPVGVPVSPLFTRPVDPFRLPPLERLVWPQTQCLVSGRERPRLQLVQSEVNIEVPLTSLPGRGFLPDLAFLVDSSGSMTYDPHSGKGEYDLVLRTIFGVFQWLRDQGMASYLRYAVLNFSTTTLYSGWQEWHNRQALFETLFHYQGAGTMVDIRKATRMVQESRGSFVAILITDGEVENSVGMAKYVTDHFTPPKGFVLIQIGGVSRLAQVLWKRGFKVQVIRNHWELQGLVLGEVRERFGS